MDIKPIIREEMYLAKAAGQDVSLPEPITRKEMFLAKMAGMEVETTGTLTRLEMFANKAAVELNRSVIEPLEITENGTYTAPDGIDGYNPVTVNVDPTKIIILRERQFDGFVLVESLGVYSPGFVSPAEFVLNSGETYHVIWDGAEYECTAFAFDFSETSMVAIGNGTSMGLPGNDEPFLITYNIPGNGTQLFAIDNSDYHTVGIWQEVKTEVKLQDKTVTENGTYSADEGYDGLGEVTVEVAGSGGSLPAGIYLTGSPILPPTTFRHKYFKYNGALYAGSGSGAGDGYLMFIYKWDGSTWSTVVSSTGSYGLGNAYIDCDDFEIAEHNGKLHIFSGKRHVVFDGITVTESTSLPTMSAYPAVYQNRLLVRCSEDKNLYEWDESNGTWITVTTFSNYYDYPFVVNGELYFYNSKKIYKYTDGVFSEAGNVSYSISRHVVLNGSLYYFDRQTKYCRFYKFDFTTNTETVVGTTPGFGEIFLSQNTGDISFTATSTKRANASYNTNYPFFVANIIEE